VLDLVAGAIGIPANIIAILKAIIVLLALLCLISTLVGGWHGFYLPKG
jgi:hypothetical protein